MRTRWVVLLVSAGLVVAGGVAGATVMAVASSGGDASSTSMEAASAAPFVCPKPPSVLDPSSTYETPGPIADFYVPAQPVVPGTPILTEEQILHPNGGTATADPESAAQPVLACQMSLGDANEIIATGVQGIIDDDRPVWVITIHERIHRGAGGAAPPLAGGQATALPDYDVMTSVVDAFTGFTIVGALGVETLR